MANDNQLDWSDLAIGLYDRLTGRKAEITYEFDNLHVKIPSGTRLKFALDQPMSLTAMAGGPMQTSSVPVPVQ
jgi:hypothetical protein